MTEDNIVNLSPKPDKPLIEEEYEEREKRSYRFDRETEHLKSKAKSPPRSISVPRVYSNKYNQWNYKNSFSNQKVFRNKYINCADCSCHRCICKCGCSKRVKLFNFKQQKKIC